MISLLLEPFAYGYMTKAMVVSAMVGGLCAFLSAYLMLKGWSLIGDALSHSVVPGVVGAYMLGLPFALGAFLAGGLAAMVMLFLTERSGLKTDVIIGMIFTSFFGLGLFMVSLYPWRFLLKPSSWAIFWPSRPQTPRNYCGSAGFQSRCCWPNGKTFWWCSLINIMPATWP